MSPGRLRKLSYSCQTAQKWPEPPVRTVAVGESKGLWRVLNVQREKLIFSFFRMCRQAACLHISAAPTVWGGLLQSGTVTGRSISVYQEQELLWRRRAGDDAEFFTEISF